MASAFRRWSRIPTEGVQRTRRGSTGGDINRGRRDVPYLSCCLNCSPYPRTLILENESTARDEIGRPIDIAGRNVVKISIRFTCGKSSCDSPESERIL